MVAQTDSADMGNVEFWKLLSLKTNLNGRRAKSSNCIRQYFHVQLCILDTLYDVIVTIVYHKNLYHVNEMIR